MQTTLAPPKPQTSLKATVMPQIQMRAAVLDNILQNFGMSADNARIAVQGYSEGTITAITIKGIGAGGYIQDQANIAFAPLAGDREVQLDLANGRSITEAVSRKLAHAVSYSIATMQRKGLRLEYTYHFAPHVDIYAACQRFGLTPNAGGGPQFQPGYAPRQMFAVEPGMDRGIRFAHSTAYRTT